MTEGGEGREEWGRLGLRTRGLQRRANVAYYLYLSLCLCLCLSLSFSFPAPPRPFPPRPAPPRPAPAPPRPALLHYSHCIDLSQ
jgi:hypothetical protein